ncbi:MULTISPECIES: hypothetical protein [Kitasatospora]|uniref:Aminoglycoside phosphotransferase domain-containing protein n=1 Tax=Kitasatospora setae (strain ATCC 33774 / DSM 43861 / JCM 3304 / KCC A-0304 / NBRC 14216 / KM-6054) TaxID=452652 RepID=E4NHM3_KITSK|nr:MULTISPECIES: hypothetical protein [Kitasatospora]BAJ31003.1 hypothetical protein KSE_52280 [Kitasatospora setae KM-6054]
MYSVPEPEVADRMRQAHAAVATQLQGQAVGGSESWGWRGRTLSRLVVTPVGDGWLRLVCAPADKATGKLWEGPMAAELSMPPGLPRPRLRRRLTWTDGDHGYLAELYDPVLNRTVTVDGPVLRAEPALDEAWWQALASALDSVASVWTSRVAVRQEYLDRAMPQFLGVPVDTTVPAWSTAHGDLHWANLTAPSLALLDWEGWGVAPVGFDAAMLHTYSLLVPEVAAQVRHHLSRVLDTPAGRFSELAVITMLLQTVQRGDNLDLEKPLRERASFLLGTTV